MNLLENESLSYNIMSLKIQGVLHDLILKVCIYSGLNYKYYGFFDHETHCGFGAFVQKLQFGVRSFSVNKQFESVINAGCHVFSDDPIPIKRSGIAGSLDGFGFKIGINPDVFEGQFRQNYLLGHGKVSQTDGTVCTGLFTKAYPEGASWIGRRVDRNGEIQEGVFEDGEYKCKLE